MSKEDDQYSRFTKYYKEVGPYLGTGVQLAVTVGIMIYIGKILDDYFETYPLFILIFAFLGIAAGMYNFIKTVLSLSKSEDENRK
jgi:ATP synthase protein I